MPVRAASAHTETGRQRRGHPPWFRAAGICCAIENPNPLRLGNARERSLTDVLNAADSRLPVQILHTRGPIGSWTTVRSDEGDLTAYDTTTSCNLCVSLMSDPEFLDDVKRVTADPDLRRRIAVERFLLLQEPGMFLGLDHRDGQRVVAARADTTRPNTGAARVSTVADGSVTQA